MLGDRGSGSRPAECDLGRAVSPLALLLLFEMGLGAGSLRYVLAAGGLRAMHGEGGACDSRGGLAGRVSQGGRPSTEDGVRVS